MWKKIIRTLTLQDVFLGARFFWLFGAVIALFVASFPFYFLMPVAKAALVAAVAIVVVDVLDSSGSK